MLEGRSVSRRFGGKEEMIPVFERVWGLLEKRGICRPSLEAKKKETWFK